MMALDNFGEIFCYAKRPFGAVGLLKGPTIFGKPLHGAALLRSGRFRPFQVLSAKRQENKLIKTVRRLYLI